MKTNEYTEQEYNKSDKVFNDWFKEQYKTRGIDLKPLSNGDKHSLLKHLLGCYFDDVFTDNPIHWNRADRMKYFLEVIEQTVLVEGRDLLWAKDLKTILNIAIDDTIETHIKCAYDLLHELDRNLCVNKCEVIR